MLIAPLPFDYATLLDRGDRVRRTRKLVRDSRVRTPASDRDETR